MFRILYGSLAVAFHLFHRYHGEATHNILDLCTFLDPRVKALEYLSDEKKTMIKEHLIDICLNYKSVAASSRDTDTNSMDTTDNSATDYHSIEKPQSALGGLLASLYAQPNVNNQDESNDIAFEVSRYKKSVAAEMHDSPLLWWKTHALLYPNISNQAKRFLAIQGSSVPAERVFSTAGAVLNDKRSRLDGGNVNKIIFLNKNMDLLEV